MPVLKFFFSTEGRINRLSYWGGNLALSALSVAAVFALLQFDAATTTAVLTDDPLANLDVGQMIVLYAVAAPLIWSSICILIKRFHDRGKSGWWWLIIFVPFLGSIWILVDCGFLRGTPGPNEHGPDPLDTTATAGALS